ncbi:MAG TPA: hypothetical protein VJ327_02825 [Patescibacteria group bacterium]|nr:hypothetical protein [Patescibacteria group bacterium]
MTTNAIQEVIGSEDQVGKRDGYGWSPAPRIVIIDVKSQPMYIVAIATHIRDAYKIVQETYGVSVAQQKLETVTDPVNMGGANGVVFVNYVAWDAPGHTVAYAMWALQSIGYDIAKMMDDYFMP